MLERPTIVVLGADEPVAAECARLAVALGAVVVGVCPGGRPLDCDEPWLQGVLWIDADPTSLAGLDAWKDQLPIADAVVISASVGPLSPALLDLLAESAEPKLVRLAVGELASRAATDLDARLEEVLLHVRAVDTRPFSEVAGDESTSAASIEPDNPDALRLETVAMAALRAALEPERRGVLDHDAVAHLGDAVMIQG